MVVRQTLLKRCRVSKNLGFQTNLFPFKRLTPRQFDLFLKTVPVFPPNRVSDLIKSLPDPPLQQEISTFFHGKFNQRLTATLQSFPSGRSVSDIKLRSEDWFLESRILKDVKE